MCSPPASLPGPSGAPAGFVTSACGSGSASRIWLTLWLALLGWRHRRLLGAMGETGNP